MWLNVSLGRGLGCGRATCWVFALRKGLVAPGMAAGLRGRILMKECPVCKTFVFDDMGVCYGCMHRFSEGGAAGFLQGLLPEIAIEEACDIEESRGGDALEEGRAALSPTSDGAADATDVADAADAAGAGDFSSEGWVLRVEMRDPREPNRSWVMELAPSPKTD